MKTHTTNYKNTFVEIAEDCSANKGEMPPVKVHCSILAEDAIKAAVSDYRNKH